MKIGGIPPAPAPAQHDAGINPAGQSGTPGPHPQPSFGATASPSARRSGHQRFPCPQLICGSSTPGKHGWEVQGYLPPPHLIGQKLCPGHTGRECWGPSPLPLNLPVSRDCVLGEASWEAHGLHTPHSCTASQARVSSWEKWAGVPAARVRAEAQRLWPVGETSHKNRELWISSKEWFYLERAWESLSLKAL